MTFKAPLVKMKIDEARLREMVVDQRMSDIAIARELSVCSVTVSHWRRRFGIEQPLRIKKEDRARSPRQRLFIAPEELRNLYETNGLSLRKIGEMYGVHQVTVSNRLRSYGIKARPDGGRRSIILPEEDLRALYTVGGKTMEEVAKHFGCGESTVRQNLIRLGLHVSADELTRRRHARNRSRFLYKTQHRGYQHVKMAGHPAASGGGYVAEHRLVAEAALGRYLEPGEQVHHINLKKRDNRIENLAVLPSKGDHARLHKYIERVAVYLCGLSDIRPEALDFQREVFWGGRLLTSIDLIQEARVSSCQRKAYENVEQEEISPTIN